MQLLQPKPPKNFFYKLADSVRVMKQQNSRNLNFVVLRWWVNLSFIINFVKIHCSNIRFSLAGLQKIFLGGLAWRSRIVRWSKGAQSVQVVKIVDRNFRLFTGPSPLSFPPVSLSVCFSRLHLTAIQSKCAILTMTRKKWTKQTVHFTLSDKKYFPPFEHRMTLLSDKLV